MLITIRPPEGTETLTDAPMTPVYEVEAADGALIERRFPMVSELIHDAGCSGLTELIDDTKCLVSAVPLVVCAKCEHAIVLDDRGRWE